MESTVVARRALVRVALVLCAAALAACEQAASSPAPPPPPQVSVAPVLARGVTPWDQFTGRIAPVETVELRPRVGGYIEKVAYEEGRRVAKGDVLFVIDQRPYRVALARTEAELAQARSRAALARTLDARARKLLDGRAIAPEEHDQRAAAAAEAEAGVRAAEAAVALARLDLRYTEVRSPIDGVAGRALVTAGNLVSAQPSPTLLTTIVSSDPVYVYFEADEQSYLRFREAAGAGAARPGAPGHRPKVRVALADEIGFPHEGTVDFVDNRVDPTTGTIRLRAVLDNHDGAFTPGLFARVRLLGRREERALLVDDTAVLTDQDRRYVYVLGPANRAMRRDVSLGRMVDGLRVVKGGLHAGDRVIVHGVQKVFFPGMPVAPQTIAMGDPPPAPPGAAPGAGGDAH